MVRHILFLCVPPQDFPTLESNVAQVTIDGGPSHGFDILAKAFA
jgi:hypothetical protein